MHSTDVGAYIMFIFISWVTEDLQEGAHQFNRRAGQVRRRMCWQNCRLNCIIAIIVIVVIAVIIIIILGEAIILFLLVYQCTHLTS